MFPDIIFKVFCFLIVFIFFPVLYPSDINAAGVNSFGGISAQRRGMGGAGIAICEDEIGNFYYNPATLNNTFIGFEIDYFNPRFSYTDPIGQTYRSKPGNFFVPFLGGNYKLNNEFSIGLGIITPYMFSSDFSDSLETKTKISLTNLSPTISYRFNESLSVGVSFKLGFGQIDIARPYYFQNLNIGRADVEANGWGSSVSTGVSWKVNKIFQVGAMYQSSCKVSFDGDITLNDISDTMTTEFYFPGRAGIGAGIHLGKWLIASDVTWFDYSKTTKSTMRSKNFPSYILALNWKNTYSYNIGVEYVLSDSITLRTGILYLSETVPDDTLTPLTPDVKVYAISAGIGFEIQLIKIDMAYTYILGKDRKIRSSHGIESYDADCHSLSFSVSYRKKS